MAGYQGCACFWLESTGMVRLSLRRFTFRVREGEEGSPGYRNCPAREWGHDASVSLDREIPLRFAIDPNDGYRSMETVPEEERPAHDDPRWPAVCAACGESFLETDEWQVNQAEVYTRGDTGATVAFRGYGDIEMKGALYDAWWLESRVIRDTAGNEHRYVGPDGIALVAICPNGAAWEVDGPSRRNGETLGAGWSRSGDPREPATLSVTPSIVAGDYHGFLTAGRFSDG